MRRDHRWLVLLGTSILLWFIIGEVNHHLARWNLSLYVGGLMLTFGLLYFPRKTGLLHALFLGLWMDAASPQPFGLSMVLFALAHLTFFHFKQKLPTEETVTAVSFALLLNAGIFLFLTLWHLTGVPDFAGYALKAATDFLLSQILILLIAPWYLALQNEILHYCGIFLEREQRMVE